ncbi:MAG: phosphatidylserine decarboxylase [Thermoanaerobaculales bacterium]|nr:phosphatidylserine decarboxylase [Thermoanaerobaculales bacterium]
MKRPKTPKLMVVDRRSGELVEEPVLGDGLLRLAYTSPLRPIVRATLFRSGLASALLGWFSDTSWSRRRIKPTVTALDIDVEEFREPAESYRTFNDFFTRRLRDGARPYDPDPNIFCSPADARLTVIPQLEETTVVPVKGATFDLRSLLRRPPKDLVSFIGGPVLIFRLCPADYHRYHFPTSGRVRSRHEISGRYDSVNPLPISLGLPVFTENRRVVSMVHFEHFGPAAFVEVGAFGVGGIVETHGDGTFEKMGEKAYFRFGSSTLILVLERNRIHIDSDLIENSNRGLESLVRAGERVGAGSSAAPQSQSEGRTRSERSSDGR